MAAEILAAISANSSLVSCTRGALKSRSPTPLIGTRWMWLCGTSMPITEEVNRVLFEGRDPKAAVKEAPPAKPVITPEMQAKIDAALKAKAEREAAAKAQQ